MEGLQLHQAAQLIEIYDSRYIRKTKRETLLKNGCSIGEEDNTTTKRLWDGNIPLHEWKENANGEILSKTSVGKDGIITWVFEENRFIPTAKLKGDQQFSILTDHLGTPISMFDGEGSETWSRELDSFGKVKDGSHTACPFMYQGQYYDKEVELAYNRFRYYDPEDGRYISKDPIGLASGEFNFYSYVDDSNAWVDIFGLASSNDYRPANKKEKEKFRQALIDIQNGDGIKRENPDGSHKEYEGRERGNHKWADSLEYELGDGNNNNRILKRTRITSKGETIVDYGFSGTHYKKITTDIEKIVVPK